MESKKLVYVFLTVLLMGCATREKFVALSERVVPKTTSIHVAGIAQQLVLSFEKGKFKIETATVPVVVGGAGVFISDNNHVLTCAHLFWLKQITGITVCRSDNQCTAAEILYQDEQRDLALIQTYFDTPTPFARLADPRKLEVGQEVLAVGSPLGLPFSVSHGIVSAVNRDDLGVYNMTQSDAFINPGNSGGPLFNLRGEIVGINSRIRPPVPAPVFTGLGFSVQSGQIIEFLTRFRGLDKTLPKYNLRYWNGFLNALGIDTSDSL